MDTAKSLVEKRYKRPQVAEEPLPSYVPKGIAYFEAYDQSQGAEDPLIPDYWIVVNKKVFAPESVQEAINELNPAVKSEKDAENIAKSMVYLRYGNAVFGDDVVITKQKERFTTIKKIEKPHVTKKKEGYNIHLEAYIENKQESYYRAASASRRADTPLPGPAYERVRQDIIYRDKKWLWITQPTLPRPAY